MDNTQPECAPNKNMAQVLEQTKALIQAPNTKAITQEANQYLQGIKAFEQDRVELAKNSAKTAWKVAAGTTITAIAAVVALAGLTPLKETQPYLVTTDSTTGITTMVKPLVDGQKVTYGEALDRYWVNTYVILRNGYVWETIQNSFDTVKLMSAPNPFATYNSYIYGEKSPTKVFKDNQHISISVKDINFLPTNSKEQKLVQVQFTRNIVSANGQPSTGYKPTHWTATMTFDYRADIKTEKQRRLNPLGFRVTSYQEDRVVLK